MKITLDIPDEVVKSLIENGGYSSKLPAGEDNPQTVEDFVATRIATFCGDIHALHTGNTAAAQARDTAIATAQSEAANIIPTTEGKAPVFNDPATAVAQTDSVQP